MNGKKNRGSWYEEDTLAVSASEIEELENDELTLEEAGFMEGYDDDLEDNVMEGDEYGSD